MPDLPDLPDQETSTTSTTSTTIQTIQTIKTIIHKWGEGWKGGRGGRGGGGLKGFAFWVVLLSTSRAEAKTSVRQPKSLYLIVIGASSRAFDDYSRQTKRTMIVRLHVQLQHSVFSLFCIWLSSAGEYHLPARRTLELSHACRLGATVQTRPTRRNCHGIITPCCHWRLGGELTDITQTMARGDHGAPVQCQCQSGLVGPVVDASTSEYAINLVQGADGAGSFSQCPLGPFGGVLGWGPLRYSTSDGKDVWSLRIHGVV